MQPVIQLSGYRAWPSDEPINWESPRAFIEAGVPLPGLHLIQTCGCPIEFLVQGRGADFKPEDALPVFFSGGRGDAKAPACFPGPSVFGQSGRPCICLADPSLSLAHDLKTGWYAGNRWQRLQDELTDILAHLSDSFGSELLLIGEGAGGFAALCFGMRLGSRASVLVWNPHTDLLKCPRPGVEAYLKAAFPGLAVGLDDCAALAESLSELGVRVSVTTAGESTPRRLLYLQDSGGPQVKAHAAPLMTGHGFMPVESDLYVACGGWHALHLGNWGQGQATLPDGLAKALMEAMCERDFMPARLFESPLLEQIAGVREPEKAPFNSVLTPLPGLGIDIAPAYGGIVASASPAGIVDYPGAAYAFYAYSRGERVRTCWYTTSRQAFFRSESDQPIDKVVAFMQDGLGRLAASSELAFDPLTAARKRIFIFGSCVSRDAFLGDMKPHDYLARSSIASAFGRSCNVDLAQADLAAIASDFQRRMVAADIRRSAAIALGSSGYDYLLLDLIDERFDLAEFGDSLVTVSSELLRAGLELPPRQQRLSPVDARRRRLWREGFRRLVQVVGEEKIILNRVFWATHDENGIELPKQADIRAANLQLARMYGFVESFEGIRAIDYPPDLIVSDSRHKWGISPFHYIPELYLHTLKSIAELDEEICHPRRSE